MSDWAALVGREHVTAGGGPDAVDGVEPTWVVRPGSVAEVQACVRAAAAAGAAVVASGQGAHLGLGNPPARLDVLLRLDRLDRVLAHEAADMTVTVEAGCALDALDRTLAGAGQWLPLDPPSLDATTVGGLVAADLSGPLRCSQGTVRDLLIGIRTVGADGALVAGGGRVVKNVAGYDLPKLHVGALGTVGVVVEATFKVRPRPAREAAVVVSCPDVARAAEEARAVLDGEVVPLWLEVVVPADLLDGPADGAALAVGIAGSAEEVEHGRAAILRAAARAGLVAAVLTDGAGLRRRIGDLGGPPVAGLLRAAALPTQTGAVLAEVGREARALGATARAAADAAHGVVRVALEDARAVAPFVRALRPGLEARGGSLVVVRAPAAAKVGLDVWGDPGPAFPLMRRVKQAFDPTGVLAPGRFVGGL